MPTGTLARSLVLTSVMSSRMLDPCLWMMGRVANSKSWLLSPARNPLVDLVLKVTIYNHFCAGQNSEEVKKSVLGMKEMGFRGVILGYAKECVLDMKDSSDTVLKIQSVEVNDQAIEEWKQGTLQTLRMIGPGDFLAVKFTGAGPSTVDALSRGLPPPTAVREAMAEICQETARQRSRLWIDAEQQVLQKTLDVWAIDLMREHNRNGTALVYNTIQAYLKSAAANANRHLKLAAEEGWTLGIKLVRGAYIAHETRSLIHDTQEGTDKSYNGIAEILLKRQFTAKSDGQRFPDVRLFLASHNQTSIRHAYSIHRTRSLAGEPTIPIEYGQLQGMADEVSGELLQECEKLGPEASEAEKSAAPRVYKCMTWGTRSECLGFLLRRAIENKGAVVRTRQMAEAVRAEVWRRIFRSA